LVADSVVASLAAAVGRVAEVRRGVGEELVMEFSKEDHEAVSAAIREAEKHTCGQIVCVLARSSSDFAYIPILWASVLALLVPWPLIDFTQWSVQRIFLLQLLVFILAGFIFSWVPIRSALVPRAVLRAQAHRVALEQFVIRGVTHTRNRCGILIFVSIAEHYARVIADEGIVQKVHQTEWQAAIDILIGQVREGRITAGFVAAVERCGAILAAHAPPDGSANELPDRLYVM
jgi:putative membrane protein